MPKFISEPTETRFIPAVSVIIPTYNRSHLLNRSVESILNQSYKDFEIIIVDDASTDRTTEIVRQFEDARIKYIQHNQNMGGSSARNTGLQASNSEFIAFLDDDDEWLPEKLEIQITAFKAAPSNVGVIYTAFWRVQNDKKKLFPPSKIKHKQGDIHKQLLNGNFIGLPTAVIRRECLEKAGLFDIRFPRLQDWEFLIRCSKHYHFIYIEKPLVISYRTDKSISADSQAFINAMDLLIDKYSYEFGKYKKYYLKHNLFMTLLFVRNKQLNKARLQILKIIRFYSFNIIILFIDFVVLIAQYTIKKKEK